MLDAAELRNGRAYSRPELLEKGKYRVLRVGNFFSNPHWYYSSLELDGSKFCDDGDLLYAWSASFGPKIWSGGKVIYHYHIWRVDPRSQVADKMFLFYWLQWDKLNIQADHGTGSTMIHVTKGDMEQRPLALPPLAEQQRIVAKLEALTARTARARVDLDRIPALTARYKQAVLQTAFSGQLSAEWRSTNGLASSNEPRSYDALKLDGAERGEWPFSDLPDGWSWRPFDAVFDDATDSRRKLPTKDYRSTGAYPIVDQGEVEVPGFTDRQDMLHPAKPPYVVFGDHTRCVKLIGTPFVQGADGVKVLLPRLDVSARYGAYLIRALGLPDKGYSRHMKFLRASYFPICSPSEQAEIVRRTETAFAEIDRLAAEAAAARRLLDRLDQAVLAKAFRGDLVPQDPADEAASTLLGRLAATRVAAPKARRGLKAAGA